MNTGRCSRFLASTGISLILLSLSIGPSATALTSSESKAVVPGGEPRTSNTLSQIASGETARIDSLSIAVITDVSPSEALVGSGPVPITITGTGLEADSIVQWNGIDIVPTTYNSATEVQAELPASALVTAGIIKISVKNPDGVSNELDFSVNNPGPVLNDVLPNQVVAGDGSFNIVLDGANFISGATVLWDGTPLNTTFVNSAQLNAFVPSYFILSEGTADITVLNPPPNSGTSNSLPFTIAPRTDTWMAHSPEGGIVWKIVVDPQRASTLYAATDYAGVYKSVDGGQSWLAINNGINGSGVADIAVDESNSSILVASGSGGTYISKNGGAFWTNVTAEAGVIKFDPQNDKTIYLGTGNGVLRTQDGAKTWSNIGTLDGSPILQMVVDGHNEGTIYALTNPSNGGARSVWKIMKGWTKWKELKFPGASASIMRSLEIDPSNSNVLYAGTEYAQRSADSGVYRTKDAGVTWEKVIPDASYYGPIIFSRSDPKYIFVGSSAGIYETSDGGDNWQLIGNGTTDVGTIDVDPTNPQILYGGGYHGLFKSLDAGVTWSPINTGLYAQMITALVYSPQYTTMFATTWTGGIWKSADYGATWNHLDPDVNYLTFLAMDPIIQLHMFTDAYETTDGGQSWTWRIFDPPTAFTFAANSDLYGVASNLAVYKSTDDGNTWVEISNGLAACPNSCSVKFIRTDPVYPNILYVGVENSRQDPALGDVRTIIVYKSVDGGETWNKIHTGPFGWFYDAFAIDPVNQSTLFLSTDDGIFKSTDGGAHWAKADTGLSGLLIPAIAVDPVNDQIVYAGTIGHGVYRSLDGGATWVAFNYGLSSLNVFALVAIPSIPLAKVSTSLQRLAAEGGGGLSGVYSVVGGQIYAYFTANQLLVFNASPASWNYGALKVGTTSAVKVFTVRNKGIKKLVIGKVTLGGTSSAQFHLTANTCSGKSLIPNATCSITATFKPTAAGAKAAYINIPDNAPGHPHKIQLTGKGLMEQSQNGGFNTYAGTSKIPSNWAATIFANTDGKDTINKKEGTASVKIANTSAKTKTLTQTRNLTGAMGSTFVFSLWGKGASIPASAGLVQAQVFLYNGSSVVQTNTINFGNGTYSWKQKSLTFTASGAYNKVVIMLTYSKVHGSVWFDGLSLLRAN